MASEFHVTAIMIIQQPYDVMVCGSLLFPPPLHHTFTWRCLTYDTRPLPLRFPRVIRCHILDSILFLFFIISNLLTVEIILIEYAIHTDILLIIKTRIYLKKIIHYRDGINVKVKIMN